MFTQILSNGIVLLALAAAVFFAARSLWRTHKAGGHCTGDCSRCGSCGGKHR